MTTFGYTLPQRGAFFGATTIPDLIESARTADRSGLFDAVWVGDSLTAKPRPESLTLLGALASVTDGVRLGVGCMASFPLRDPITFAYQWANLDQISSGRMALAACTGIVAGGASAAEGALFGVRDVDRPARLEENIAVCRLLWSTEDASFAGRFTSFEGLTLEPKPRQQPCPIYIAANPFPGPAYERAVARVAAMADGWMTVRLFPDMTTNLWRDIRRRLEEEGRDPDAFPTMAYHNININEDREAALDESKRFLDAYYGPVFAPGMVEAWTAAGSPRQCAEHLSQLAEEGMGHIALRTTSWDQKEQYERLVEEVLPLVTSGP